VAAVETFLSEGIDLAMTRHNSAGNGGGEGSSP
jgi:hypothetical protein